MQDIDWNNLALLRGATIKQPSLFSIGEHDSSRSWLAHVIDEQTRTLPGPIANEVIPGPGQWLQQEDPDQINELLLRWLDQARSS